MIRDKIKWLMYKKKSSGVLPDGYTECEYLESNGTQYIDTGIACNGVYLWEWEMAMTNPTVTNSALLGSIYNNSGTYQRFHNSNTTSQGQKFWIGASDSTYITVGSNKTKFTIDSRQTARVITIGTQSDTLTVATSNIPSLAFWLFRRNSNVDSLKNYGYEKIYTFKVYDTSDTLVQNLIPCLDKSGEPCMYDTVSKKTFYNEGTGDFAYHIKGNIPSNYTLCEYLESSGTQYIDLGFKPKTGISGKTKLTAPATETVQCALGSMTSTSNRFDLFTFGVSSSNGVFGLGYTTFKYLDAYTASQTYELEAGLLNGNQYLKVDGEQIYTGTVTGSISSNYNMLLFARYKLGALDSYYSGKIYYVELYQDGVLFMNLIPCLDSYGEACMYDTVSGTTFYNQGTGDFSYEIAE